MKRALVIALLALIAAAFTGCVEDDPCTELWPMGKGIYIHHEDDGTPVTVDGRPATCQDGEAVFDG